MCLSSVAQKADRRGVLRQHLRRSRVGTSVQHRPYSVCANYSPESERTPPRIVASPLGTRSIMGQGFFCRCQDDQRKIRNGGLEARILRCVEISQVPDSRGRFLRVAEERKRQTTI